MAVQNLGTTGTSNVTTTARRRTARNRARAKTAGIRPGVGTGVGPVTSSNGGLMAIEHFGSYMRGAVEGFALANNIAPTAVLSGAKKHLTW